MHRTFTTDRTQPETDIVDMETQANIGIVKLNELAGKKIVLLISTLKGIKCNPEYPEAKSFEAVCFLVNRMNNKLKRKRKKPMDFEVILGGGSPVNLTKEQWRKVLNGLKEGASEEELVAHVEEHFLPFAKLNVDKYQKENCNIEQIKREAEQSKEKEPLTIKPKIMEYTQAVAELKGNYIKAHSYFINKHKDKTGPFAGEVTELREGFLTRGDKELIVEEIKKIVLEFRPDLAHINFTEFVDTLCDNFLLSEYGLVNAYENTVFLYGGVSIKDPFRSAFEGTNNNSYPLALKRVCPDKPNEKIIGSSMPYIESQEKKQNGGPKPGRSSSTQTIRQGLLKSGVTSHATSAPVPIPKNRPNSPRTIKFMKEVEQLSKCSKSPPEERYKAFELCLQFLRQRITQGAEQPHSPVELTPVRRIPVS